MRLAFYSLPDMGDEPRPIGPSLEEMIDLLREAQPDAVVATASGAVFFSLDETHWPNFATIVWTDEHDEGAPSNLAREGVYRVNISLDTEAFQRLVGDISDPDYAAIDQLVPHPTYATHRWVSILNPSHAMVRDTVLPLAASAYDRLAARRQQ